MTTDEIQIGDELIVKQGCIISHWFVSHVSEEWVIVHSRDKRKTASLTHERYRKLKVWSDKAKESLARIDEEERQRQEAE